MIDIGIKVDKSQVVDARQELKRLMEDKKRYGIDLDTPVEVTTGGPDRERTGTMTGAAEKTARHVGLLRKEMTGASAESAKVVRDFEKLIKISGTAKISAGIPGISTITAEESLKMRRETKKDVQTFWDSAGLKPKRMTAAEAYYSQHGDYGEVAQSGGNESGHGGNAYGVLGGALVGRLTPWVIAAYGANKMRQMWAESGGDAEKTALSKIPHERLGEKIGVNTLLDLNHRLLFDQTALLGMYNTMVYSGIKRGTSLEAVGINTANRASAMAMDPSEMGQKQNAIGQHIRNLSYGAGQSQSDILAATVLKTGTQNLAPRLFDATIRLMSSVGAIRGIKDMSEGDANRMAHVMAGFWGVGKSINSRFFMGDGIENLYSKAAGGIARGGGDPNTRMFMARALGADKIHDLNSMWGFKSNMEDAANPKNQFRVVQEAMRMAKLLGLQGDEGRAFAKLQLQEAYGNMSTREIDVLMSRPYNEVIARAGNSPGKLTQPDTPDRIAETEGMRLKANEGRKDIEMSGKMGHQFMGFSQWWTEVKGDLAAAANKQQESLDKATAAQDRNTRALEEFSLPLPTTKIEVPQRYRTPNK